MSLICNNCGWDGDDMELVRKTDSPDDNDFSYCPDCESDDFDDEDEEEDGED